MLKYINEGIILDNSYEIQYPAGDKISKLKQINSKTSDNDLSLNDQQDSEEEEELTNPTQSFKNKIKKHSSINEKRDVQNKSMLFTIPNINFYLLNFKSL